MSSWESILAIVFLGASSVGGFAYGIWSYFNEEERTLPKDLLALTSLGLSLMAVFAVWGADLGDRYTLDWWLVFTFFGGTALCSSMLFYGLFAYFGDNVREFIANVPLLFTLALTCLVMGQIITFFRGLDDSFWPPEWLPVWLAGILPILALFATFMALFRGLLFARRPLKEFVARSYARLRHRPYFLLLRSFGNRFNLDAPEGMTFDKDGGMVSVPGLPIIPRLTTALTKLGSVVAIGRFDFNHAADATNAIQIKTSDENWRAIFDRFAKHAKGIVVIPSDTDGLVEELAALHGSPALWKKTVIFVPPELKSGYLIGSVSNRSDLDENWPHVASTLRGLGIDVPEWAGHAMFYLPSTGRIERIEDAGILRVAKAIRTAFKLVNSELDGESQSFAHAYRAYRATKRVPTSEADRT